MKSMKMVQRVQRGFTLIELMIVVAIIGILAAVAIPQYQDYVLKSKWSTAVTGLDGLKKAIFACLQNNDNAAGSCDTAAKLNNWGFAGTNLPTPQYASGVVTLTANTNKVTVAFTGDTTVGSYVYSADCGLTAAADGNMACLSTAADTLVAKTGWTAGATQKR